MKSKKNIGVMLDCSRNAVMSPEQLKKFICTLERIGYNSLQLYMEDTYEVDGEPFFGHLRGGYSKAELKELDAYAAQHGVELIPCIQTLAHFNQLVMWDAYKPINDVNDILLVGNERTYELIDKLFSVCAECFTTKKLHIGMDEAVMMGRGKYYEQHGDRKRFDLLLEHLERVRGMAQKYNFELMMWSDMFFRIANNGRYSVDGANIPDYVKAATPNDVTLVYWDYYQKDEERYNQMLSCHKQFGQPVTFAGGARKWYGFQADNAGTIIRTRAALSACEKNGINDILITLWGDDGNECPVYAVLPSLVYAFEAANGNYSVDNARARFEELTGESWDDFMLFDMPLGELVREAELGTGAKEMLLSDCFLGKFDATVIGDGSERAEYARLAERFAAARLRSGSYGYLFEHYERLCRALAVKYDLGYRTKTAYKAGDLQALSALLPEYDSAIRLTEEFLEAFRRMWYHDNKAHGFDVQDIRIGGSLQRMKSCRARLGEYVEGRLDRIEELEAPMLDIYAEPHGKRLPQHNNYAFIATANIL